MGNFGPHLNACWVRLDAHVPFQTDNRLEDYMDSLERMADRMGSKFHNLNFRTVCV